MSQKIHVTEKIVLNDDLIIKRDILFKNYSIQSLKTQKNSATLWQINPPPPPPQIG